VLSIARLAGTARCSLRFGVKTGQARHLGPTPTSTKLFEEHARLVERGENVVELVHANPGEQSFTSW